MREKKLPIMLLFDIIRPIFKGFAPEATAELVAGSIAGMPPE